MPSFRSDAPALLLLAAWMTAMPPALGFGAGFPWTVTDALQKTVRFSAPPRRVVCLAPSITEMVVKFGREQALVGLTRQDLLSNSALRKKNVGTYFNPDLEAIRQCDPDLIIAAPSHETVIRAFAAGPGMLWVVETGTLEEAFFQMEAIGRIFDCETEAAAVVTRNREELAWVKAKVIGIPEQDRKRVVRVMAGDRLSCPGDDAFQNEMIEAAGGITPRWGKTGFAVPVDLDAWRRFNPHLVYGCHLNEKSVNTLLHQEGIREVAAVQTGAVTFFPCELTCRVSTRVGAFVSWLAAVLYPDIFADPEKALLQNTVLVQKPVAVNLAYVSRAQVVTHRVADVPYKSLVVTFKRPMDVLSTFEGNRPGVQAVGNTFVPMHASLGHMARGVEAVQHAIAANLGFETAAYAGLMTGADMDNLSIQEKTAGDLSVTALVTAGVRGNALRVAEEIEAHEPLGTINIIVLTNHRLSPRAMTWALVVITEAKSAALQDLDIRSTHTPWEHPATGTGTDTIIVVQGEGPEAPHASGHSRIGQLMARAVHAGVTEAILKQNGIQTGRNIFQRLNERKLRIEQIATLFPVQIDPNVLASRIEGVLTIPYYAAFMESALAIDDAHRNSRIEELGFFDTLCASVTTRLAGKADVPALNISEVPLPAATAKAFGALICGIEAMDAAKDRRP